MTPPPFPDIPALLKECEERGHGAVVTDLAVALWEAQVQIQAQEQLVDAVARAAWPLIEDGKEARR